jgi:hydroxymethylglutaryl-CoA reductase (NADPH)
MEGGRMDLENVDSPKPVGDEDETGPARKRPLPLRMVYTEEARHKRLDFLAAQVGRDLNELRAMRFKAKDLRGNIESFVGTVEIPVGIAGPLLIRGTGYEEEIFAPIATTEGALVSSVNRGCRALVISGGVTARVLKQRMVRAPLFDCGGIEECLHLKTWIEARWGEIQRRVREHSNHAVLLELDFRIIAPALHVRFVFETGDASGQNMTTLCTWNICQWILASYAEARPGKIRQFIIDGNLSTDKKASRLSAVHGRGREVVAEAAVPGAVLRRIFNITPASIVRYFQQAMSTGVLTGVHGLNVNVANIIAAIFAATGQDIACVHESSTGQIYFEERGPDLYISLLLPCLVIGTVGGGVSIGAQKTLLEMMGAYGPGKANRLAEIIASFALALELSTGGALTSGTFAEAHERLGRKKEQWWLKKSDLNAGFFTHLLARECESSGPVIEAEEMPLNSAGESLVMSLTSQISQRPCGLWAYKVQFAKTEEPRKVFLKVKVPDDELLLAQEILAAVSSPGLGELLRDNRADSPFRASHVRELKIAALDDPTLRSVSPRVLGWLHNESRGIFILAQEFLENLGHFEAVEKRELWRIPFVEAAIRDIAKVHARFLGQTQEFAAADWIVLPTIERITRLREAHFELARQLHRDSMEWFTAADLDFHERALDRLHRLWRELAGMPQTLVHNDFNPRNLAFRTGAAGAAGARQPALVVYDWELATVHVPQRDVAEFLCFTLTRTVTRGDLAALMELHRCKTEEISGRRLDRAAWLRGFEIALYDVILQRFPIYAIAQTMRQVPFLKPSYQTARHLLALVQEIQA